MGGGEVTLSGKKSLSSFWMGSLDENIISSCVYLYFVLLSELEVNYKSALLCQHFVIV